MIRQPGRHRRRPLLPLAPQLRVGGDPEAVVDPAEVVRTPDQVHPRSQRVRSSGDRPATAGQLTKGTAERRVEPLDVRRVNPRPGPGRREHRGDGLGGPPDYPAGDGDEASSGVVLDHLAQEQPGRGHQPWPARTAGAHRVAEDSGEGGHVAGQPIDTDQEGQVAGGPTDHPHDGQDQGQVTVEADHPAQPEPRRDGHRQSHPEPPGHHLDVQLIGLDVTQLDLTAQDVMLVEALPVPARSIAPGGDGPLVEPEGGDDRLQRTAMAEQGQHDDHQLGRLLEAVERGVVSSGEGPITGGTAVTPLLATVNADVSEPALPACGAVGVVAELGLRVQRRSSRGTVWRPYSEGCSVDPRFSSLYHPHHGSLGCYLRCFAYLYSLFLCLSSSRRYFACPFLSVSQANVLERSPVKGLP